jgi:hypothetical protein
MSQRSFASVKFVMKTKRTLRRVFFVAMEQVVPWLRLLAVIKSLYLQVGVSGASLLGFPRCCACTACSGRTAG